MEKHPSPLANGAAGAEDGDFEQTDIVRIIQERDAYKKETEKLWKIIEKQRYIIKSLQSQINRRQNSSAGNTPSLTDSIATPDPADTHMRLDLSVDSSDAVKKTPHANALGLESLSMSSPAGPAGQTDEIRVSGASLTSLSDAHDAADAELDQDTSKFRPWAKSTRLSEIYADYSARHNSVGAGLRPGGSDWAAAGLEHSVSISKVPDMPPIADASNRLVSATTPHHIHTGAGKHLDWVGLAANEYGSDNSRISSFAAMSSRGGSMSLDDMRRRSNYNSAPSPVTLDEAAETPNSAPPEVPDDYVNSIDRLARSAQAGSGPATKQAQSHSLLAISNANGSVYSDDQFSIENNVGTPRTPYMATEERTDEAADQGQMDHLVLRPISTIESVDLPESTPDIKRSQLEQRDLAANDWKPAEISGYEYDGAQTDSQPPARSQIASPSFGATTNGTGGSIGIAIQPVGKHGKVSNPRDLINETESSLGLSHSLHPYAQAAPSSVASHGLDTFRPGMGSHTMSPPTGGDQPKWVPNNLHAVAPNEHSAMPAPPKSAPTPAPARTPMPMVEHHDVPERPPLRSLHNIDLEIKDSKVKIDERGKEVNVYMIHIKYRFESPGLLLREALETAKVKEKILWTVEKRYSDFLNLNGKLRNVIQRSKAGERLERLPDKDIFRANAPNKNDKRKLWFEKYLKKALTLNIPDLSPILEFLSTNIMVEPASAMPILLGHKEGFLVKKGKNFGGWKRRYYVCKSNQPVLEYFETPGGSPIGSINLRGAVVKTGRTPAESTPMHRSKPNQKDSDIFRHAFLIEEVPKRAGKEPIAHPLWADSDRERDEWVAALRYVIVRDAEGPQRAIDEVAKYAVLLNNKKEKLPMIQQIQTSITHEQGARRSLEYNRMRQEQRQMSDGAVSHKTASPLQRRPSTATANLGSIGSPLTNQVWPASSSMGDMDRCDSQNADKDYVGVKNPGASYPHNLGPPDSLEPPPPHLPVDARPRSLSFPPNENRYTGNGDDGSSGEGGDGKTSQHLAAKLSPQEIVTRLSASFAEFSTPASEQKQGKHLSPLADDSASEQYTIDSSMYSMSRENDPRNGLGTLSSHPTIDNRESVLSLPDSFTSPHDADDERASMALSPGHSGVSEPPATAPPTTLTFQGLGSGGHLPQKAADPSTQLLQSMSRKAAFTKDSTGRIVREEDETVLELPLDTPRVTDDILGVGRQYGSANGDGSSGDNSSSRTNIFGNKNNRTREEKKRGRITFMWGKRKPVDPDTSHPDMPTYKGSNSSLGSDHGERESSGPVSMARRLRRGSISNDTLTPPVKHKSPMVPVFGLPLEMAVQATKVREHYELPAVVYRCIEYLDVKKAWLEEGIYRMSGSFAALDSLRKSFNTCRDFNLLKMSSPPDVHAVASLLKAYLRELPQSVLTSQLHQDFVRVVDYAERRDRVMELGRLVSLLPLANYTLLRALTAHLIRVVLKAPINKMTLRNIGIVFSPSLGIPVGVFSLLMVEFEYIFWVNDKGSPEPRSLSSSSDNDMDDATEVSSLGQPSSSSVPQGARFGDDRQLQHVPSNSTSASQSDQMTTPRLAQVGGVVVPPSSKKADRTSNTVALIRPSSPRGDGSNARRLDNTLSMAAVGDAPWYKNPSAAVNESFNEFQQKKQQMQQQQMQQSRDIIAPNRESPGRNNRNSMQYFVGAPHELISQEQQMSIPDAVSETDDDSAFEDPMMRLSRHGSSQTLQSRNLPVDTLNH